MKKTLLLLVLLMAVTIGARAGGETTTLLEYGTTNVPWTAENLADWTAGGSPTLADGVVTISGGNGGYETSKTISPTANAIINVTAVWRGASSTGRDFSKGNGSYFRFGNIIVAQNDQDKKHGYEFTGLDGIASVTTFAAGSYRVDVTSSTWLKIEAEINTAENKLTSFTIKSEDGATTYASASDVTLSTPDYTAVAFGYKKGSSVTTTNKEQLKSIIVTQTTQDVKTANYTLNYINGELTVKSVNGELSVGATVSTDASFFVEDAKYFRQAGEPESFTIADGENNFSVKVRPAETFNYSLLSSLGATLTSGSGIEGETVNVGYPRYQLNEGNFYEAGVTNKEYRKSLVLSEDNVNATVDYAEWNGSNDVVFYAEGENIDGFTVSTAGNVPVRASNAKAGTAAEDVAITSLPAGKYKLHVGIFTSASSGYADKVVNFGVGSETFAAAFTGVNLNEVASDEITVAENSDVKFIAEGSWTGAQFDYIWIEKTGEYVPPIPAGTYDLTLADGSDAHGTVSFTIGGETATKADKGDVVTVSVAPAEGFVVKSVTARAYTSWENAARATSRSITDAPEVLDNIVVEKQEDGTWKFTMPEANALVQVEYDAVYAINIAESIVGGTVAADPTTAKAGDEVTLINTPAEGYEFVSYSVTGVHEDLSVEVTDGKFTMPADDVTVNATFAKVYAVNIAEGIENGTVAVDTTKAKAGDIVTITATPAEDYDLVSVSVTGVNTNKAVEVTDGKFEMPEDDVTVNAEFQQLEKIALTADMFYTWDGYGADASKISSATVDFKVGESVDAGATVVGTGGVDYLTYADMTGSIKVIFEGKDGTAIRLLMNRQESNNGPLVEKNATIAEGKAEIYLTDLDFVHINAIKIPYNGSTGNIISAIRFAKPIDPLAIEKEALKEAIAAAKMRNSVAKTEESFAALTKAVTDGEAALVDAKATAESLTTAKSDIETAIKGLTLAEGYAEVTKEMFKQYASVEEPGEGTTTDGAYELFTASDLPYGDSNVSELKWADLTKYDKLIVTTVGTTAPRFCMNRLVANGQQAATQEASKMIDINPNNDYTWSTEKYQTASDGVYTIDLATIVSDYGFARLHCIKKQGWGAGVVVTGMYLHEAPAYTVNIAESIVGGTVVADPTSAVAGEKVTLTATPAEGYTLASVSVTGVHEELAVEVTDGKFTMPADDVTVSATFEKTPYSIEYALGMQNGTVTGPASATVDEKVTLTVTPAEGYELETLTITCKGTENEINYDVTDYSFTMPAQGVYVIATFKKKVVYIETDLTKDFISLTSPTTWKSETPTGVGQAEWAAPKVTVAGNKYFMIENYVGTQALKEVIGGVMYNEITGLTPGLYTIELYGSAAVTVRDDITATFTEGDEASLSAVYLYAESNGEKVKKYIPCLIETNFNNRGGEESIPRATLDNVVVGNDGKIKIGLYKEVGLTNWHIVQLKSVTAKVSASDLLAKAVATASAIAESDVPAALYSEIQEAITTYDKEYATADEYQTAINALNALVDKANGYSPLAAVINEGAQYKANVPAEDPAIAAYDQAIADVKAAYDAAVVADIPAAVKVVEAALPALAKAQTAPNSDMTRAIVNPTINGVSGWTCERPKGGGGPELPAGGSFEYWAGSANPRNEAQFDYYQVIEGLPSGKYIISAEMYNSLNDEAGAEFAATSGVYGASGNDETATLVDVEGTTLIRYATEPVFVKDGTLRLGVKNTVLPVAARWFVADNFTLTLVETIPTYEVDLAEPQNGAIEVSAAVAAEDDKVIITATPNEGYELESVSVKGVTSDIAVQVVTDEITGEMSFTMPNDAVVVSATFKEIAYPITYAIGMQNGNVEGPVESVAGEKVTLTVTPAEGYELETLTIRAEMSENIIEYDVVDYSFTMPKEGVYIIATFVQPTGIDAASAAKNKKIGVKKYFKNGELIIIGKDGKEYRANGTAK